jgi:hypothetical protein
VEEKKIVKEKGKRKKECWNEAEVQILTDLIFSGRKLHTKSLLELFPEKNQS